MSARPALLALIMVVVVSCSDSPQPTLQLDATGGDLTALADSQAPDLGTDAWAPDSTTNDATAADATTTDGPTATGCGPCGPASSSTICMRGKVYAAAGLLTHGAVGAKTVAPGKVQLRVYDLWGYNTHTPLASGLVGPDGCFTFSAVASPTSKTYFLETSFPGSKLIATGVLLPYKAGQNHDDLQIPAVDASTQAAWSNSFSTSQTLVIWYRGAKSGKGIAGVVPLRDGKPAPWSGVSSLILDADMTTAPYLGAGSSTTASGLVAVPSPGSSSYSGVKAGCTVGSNIAAGPVSRLHFVVLDVSGC